MAKFYVTTSIAYTNGPPHIGYAMELIQADVLARYHRQQGDDVWFATGTDEHGQKVAQAAADEKLEPQQYVDKVSKAFQDLAPLLDVSNDDFVRTTQPAHIKAAQAFWKLCEADIYKKEYEGWYCVRDEIFYTPTEASDKKCPVHHDALEQVKEENYFFKLSKYTKQVKEAVASDKLRIVPATRKNEIMALLESGLEDISISRDHKRLSWGIPVPGDKTQVMYVWFDALTNYLTTIGYPNKDYQNWWPAQVQLIGKDILRFHAAIWPGMLLSAGLPLPEVLYVHGFIEADGQKMSKSVGNVIDPVELVQHYGADAVRYYLLREIPSDGDGNFTAERMEQTYNTDLANDLGNLVQRVAVMIIKYFDGQIGEVPAHSHDEQSYLKALEALRFDRALAEVWELVRGLNQYIEGEQPWKLGDDTEQLHVVLGHAVADLQLIAKLLLPFLPATAEKILATFADGTVHSDVGVLFPKNLAVDTSDTIEEVAF